MWFRDTVSHLDVDFATPFAERTVELSREGQAIHNAMTEYGLMPMPERARLFSAYSGQSAKSIAIGVIPFVSEDLSMAGGLSISQGGYAKGVAVHLKDRTKVISFATFDVVDGEVKMETFRTEQLMEMGAEKLAAKAGSVLSHAPLIDLSVRQVRSITGLAHSSLLADESSHTVHSIEEIHALRGNSRIVSEIGAFVLLRSAASPGGCSCSSSCWGCSSCSCSWG